MASNRSENPVVLSRIYTRTGDDGTTALGDGSRTAKTDSRLAAYADVDEANSAIGMVVTFGELPPDIVTLLTRVQNEMFDVGADLATPVVESPPYPPLRIDSAYVERLEGECDAYNSGLPTLRSFLLPGGSRGSTLLHVARTVTRRAERSAWAAAGEHGDSMSPWPARYLNRLSDLLFILSRVANAGHGDVLWKPGGDRGLEGRVQVGAGGRGFEPDEQAGERRLGQRQIQGAAGAVPAQLALRHDAARAEDGHFFRGGRALRHHGQVAAREGLLGAHRKAEDAVPAELVELVGG
jgi:cob(I)alamin adenosyltransferase